MISIDNPICPVCQSATAHVFDATVLGRHPTGMYRCTSCGLIRTGSPTWLEEAYASAIAQTDTGLVQRNISNASTLETLLEVLGFASGRLLDVAGGYGLLCRLLRDKGFDCHTTDKFCQNIFAQDFEPQAGFKADVLFAYEVLEHIESPREFIEDALHWYGCRNLIFSTMTFAEVVPAPDWWYYSFETGQHITFYTLQALDVLAQQLGCHRYSLDASTHMFLENALPRPLLRDICEPKRRAKLEDKLRSKRAGMSFTFSDHLLAKKRLRTPNDKPRDIHTPGDRSLGNPA